MTVGDQDVTQVAETNAGLQNLPLGAFPAIDEKPVLVMHEHLGGEAATGRWSRGRGAKEEKLEHRRNYTLRTPLQNGETMEGIESRKTKGG